jgi:DNA-binding LacI/PurR family transcriptional regulator
MKTSVLVKDLNDAPRSRVVRSLKQWMDEGVLVEGEPLPSERALSEKLQVDRGTVRRALAMLDEQGLVRSHNGRTRVVNRETHERETRETPQRSAWMQNAVAVLTHTTGGPWTGHRQSGWSDYIGHGAVHAIRQQGMHAVALEPERLTQAGIAAFLAEQPSGVVITDIGAPASSALLQCAGELRRKGVPVVVYGDAPEMAGFDRVTSDHAHGSYLLTRWLIDSGRRHILPVTPEPATGYWMPQRSAGYERAMHEAGLQPLPALVVPSSTQATFSARLHSNARAWSSFLKEYFEGQNPVDALMLSSDGGVTPAAEACRLLGREPNRDVALVGYDNYWLESPEREFEPTAPLATVDKLNLKMGAALIDLLCERIAGKLPAQPQRRVVQPQLTLISTTGGN